MIKRLKIFIPDTLKIHLFIFKISEKKKFKFKYLSKKKQFLSQFFLIIILKKNNVIYVFT